MVTLFCLMAPPLHWWHTGIRLAPGGGESRDDGPGGGDIEGYESRLDDRGGGGGDAFLKTSN